MMLEINLMLKNGEVPLYEQIYSHLTQQIITGKLPKESKMPGRRSLASALGVSVSTIDTVYQMMTAEGYLESRPRSGYYVQDSAGLFHSVYDIQEKESVTITANNKLKYEKDFYTIICSIGGNEFRGCTCYTTEEFIGCIC